MSRRHGARVARAVRSALLATAVLGCQAPTPDAPTTDLAATLQDVVVPGELQRGENAYDASCAVCHGSMALGTAQGPPLVHTVYEPSHHADIAFFMAVQRGVRAHHWSFGDMPPVPGVSREEVEAIVEYVRFLQRAVGID